MDHVSALAAATRLHSYVVERILGAGSFGITYLAREDVTGRAVAIKEYLPASFAVRERDSTAVRPISQGMLGDFQWGLDRFRQEAKILIDIKHPNVVPVLAYFEENSTGYLVMEFQEGRSLGAILEAERTLSEERTIAIMRGVMEGVSEVHRLGYLHRDLKPDNIFIREEDGAGLLLDFGAAREAAAAGKALTTLLTEGYAPFEQYAENGNQGPWTDVYALGAIMFRCLVGHAPPESPRRAAAALRGAPDPIEADLERLRGLVSTGLYGAVAAALRQSETDRPQDIAALRSAIDGPTLTVLPRSEDPPTVLSQPEPLPTLIPDRAVRLDPPPPPPRRYWRHGAIAAGLLAAVAGGAFLYDRDRWLPDAYRAAAEAQPAPRTVPVAKASAAVPPPAWRDVGLRHDAERRSMESLEAEARAQQAARQRQEAEDRRIAEERAGQAEEAARQAEEEKTRAEEQRQAEEQRRREQAARQAEDEKIARERAEQHRDEQDRAARERERRNRERVERERAQRERAVRRREAAPPQERRSERYEHWPPTLPGQGSPDMRAPMRGDEPLRPDTFDD